MREPTKAQMAIRLIELSEALSSVLASHSDLMDYARRTGGDRCPNLAWSQEIEDHGRQVLAEARERERQR